MAAQNPSAIFEYGAALLFSRRLKIAFPNVEVIDMRAMVKIEEPEGSRTLARKFKRAAGKCEVLDALVPSMPHMREDARTCLLEFLPN